MSILDRLRKPKTKKRLKHEKDIDKGKMTPGRPSMAGGSHGGSSLGLWRSYAKNLFSSSALYRYQPVQILELITLYNPDASQAVWNFLRLVNPDYKLVVRSFPDLQEENLEAKILLERRTNEAFGVYGRDYGGGLGPLIDVLTLTILIQGAVAGELELNEDITDVDDWNPVDPRLIVFDTDEMGHFVPSINIGGQTWPLPEEQFRYLPLDPGIRTPQGRPPLLPTLETVFFQTEVLRDLKAVAHIQGHPRLKFTLLEEMVMRYVPANLRVTGQEEALGDFMAGFLADVAADYALLQPDDAIFTFDYMEVEGVSAGKGTYDLGELVKVVEQQVISSLKHLPMLLGRMEGSGLAHGSVQWQIFAQTIKALQKKIAVLVDWWASQTLRVLGIPAIARLEFPEIRTQDRLKAAQAEALEVQTGILMFQMGWVKNAELAEKFAGHPPVTEDEEPVAVPQAAKPTVEEEPEMEEGTEERQDFGIPTQSEALFFEDLPRWMTNRLNAVEASVIAMTTVRRGEKFDELEGEDGGRSSNGRYN